MKKFFSRLNFFSKRPFENDSYMYILNDQQAQIFKKFRKKIKYENIEKFTKTLQHSKSQILQDMFVLNELNFKRNGFFVEFGATNGVDFSNSHILEKHFNWNGILAEPAQKWHQDLNRNRSANIDYHCVWKDSGEVLMFNETEIGEISTIDYYTHFDQFSKERQNGKRYEVTTISLIDLLDKYNAPKIIDYLSIDTEGSEWEILRLFDFDKYKFRVITCEHNYSSKRKLIYKLLSSQGYKRKYLKCSKFDDWYVLED